MNNKAYWDRIKFAKSKQTTHNSVQDCENRLRKVNPFFRKIDRHYGSFKTKLLGNYKNIFNSLPYKELKPLGRNATGCRRKKLTHPSFTALFYANGTVEIKPVRDKGFSPDLLQAAFFSKAKQCCSLLERKGYSLAPLKINRRPKYGYRDKTASFVKQEYQGQDRGMDSTPDPNSVDNYSCKSTKRDLRISDEQNFKIARARADNPEVILSIEAKLEAVANASYLLGKNMETHVGIMQEMKVGLHELALGVRSVRKPRHRFHSSFKKSATVAGCN